MVSVLTTAPEVRGFKPSRGDGFLRAIKIRSTTYFGQDVKTSAPCSKILRHVKDRFEALIKIIRRPKCKISFVTLSDCYVTPGYRHYFFRTVGKGVPSLFGKDSV
jgi:hypothetical protein